MAVDLLKKYNIASPSASGSKPVDLLAQNFTPEQLRAITQPKQSAMGNFLNQAKGYAEDSIAPYTTRAVNEIIQNRNIPEQALYGAAEPVRNVENLMGANLNDFPQPQSMGGNIARNIGTGATAAATLPVGGEEALAPMIAKLMGQGAIAGGLGGSKPSAINAITGAVESPLMYGALEGARAGLSAPFSALGRAAARGLAKGERFFNMRTPAEVAEYTKDMPRVNLPVENVYVEPSQGIVMNEATKHAIGIKDHILGDTDPANMHSELRQAVAGNKDAVKDKYKNIFGQLIDEANATDKKAQGDYTVFRKGQTDNTEQARTGNTYDQKSTMPVSQSTQLAQAQSPAFPDKAYGGDEDYDLWNPVYDYKGDLPIKLNNYKKALNEIMSKNSEFADFLSPKIKKFAKKINSIKTPSVGFQEGHSIQSALGKASSDFPKEKAAYGKLQNAVLDDIGEGYKGVNEDLYNRYLQARKGYKDEYVPYLEPNITKIIDNKKDMTKLPDLLLQSQNKRVLGDLDEKGKNLVLAHKLEKQVAKSNDPEAVKLNTSYNNLRGSVKNNLVSPELANRFKRLDNILKLYRPEKTTRLGLTGYNMISKPASLVGKALLGSPSLRDAYIRGGVNLPIYDSLNPMQQAISRNALISMLNNNKENQ